MNILMVLPQNFRMRVNYSQNLPSHSVWPPMNALPLGQKIMVKVVTDIPQWHYY